MTAPPPPNDPAPAALPAFDQFICFAVYSAGHAFNRVYKPLLEPLGLTYPQFLVMVLLWEEDDRSVGNLGEALALESSTLTPLLKRLEAMGHIGRSRDPADERVVRIRLTDRGRALKAQAATIPACIMEATGLGPEGLERLQRDVVALRGALQHYGEAAKPG